MTLDESESGDGETNFSETTTLLPPSVNRQGIRRRLQLEHGSSPEHFILL